MHKCNCNEKQRCKCIHDCKWGKYIMKKQCNWTENKEINGKSVIIECKNTNTIKDEDNIKDRWFCVDQDTHIEMVKYTRKIMHRKCTKTEKLLNFYEKFIEDYIIKFSNFSLQDDHPIKHNIQGRLDILWDLQDRLINKEFDYE